MGPQETLALGHRNIGCNDGKKLEKGDYRAPRGPSGSLPAFASFFELAPLSVLDPGGAWVLP